MIAFASFEVPGGTFKEKEGESGGPFRNGTAERGVYTPRGEKGEESKRTGERGHKHEFPARRCRRRRPDQGWPRSGSGSQQRDGDNGGRDEDEGQRAATASGQEAKGAKDLRRRRRDDGAGMQSNTRRGGGGDGDGDGDDDGGLA